MNLLTTVKNLKHNTMSSYCLKCRKNTENINPRVLKTKNDKAMIISKCTIWFVMKKSWFIKNQDLLKLRGMLRNLRYKTQSSKIPLLSDILF